MDTFWNFERGDIVDVVKHRCSGETIGPFDNVEILWFEGETAIIEDHEGNEWGIDVIRLLPAVVE